jgi:hypothetical protein
MSTSLAKTRRSAGDENYLLHSAEDKERLEVRSCLGRSVLGIAVLSG